MQAGLKTDLQLIVEGANTPWDSLYKQALVKMNKELKSAQQLKHQFTDVLHKKEQYINIPNDFAKLFDIHIVTLDKPLDQGGFYQEQEALACSIEGEFIKLDKPIEDKVVKVTYYKALDDNDTDKFYPLFFNLMLSLGYDYIDNQDMSIKYNNMYQAEFAQFNKYYTQENIHLIT